MPTYWAPPPGNMKTTSGASPTRLCVKTRRGSPASISAAASSWLAATTTRRRSKARRPSLSVKATSASGCSGCSLRCAASALALASSAARERAESVSNWNGQSEGSDFAGRGASSSTAWALVPPTPSEFTPARRGASAFQAVSRALTRNGLASKSIAGFGRSKPRLGGIWRWWSASAALIRLATPAAVSRWPMLVLTEPMRQKPRASVVSRNAAVRAATSIGSPRYVPVPWHST